MIVEAERTHLELLVENLVGNAAKYSPEGSPIDVRVEEGEDEVRVLVLDRGIGLDEHPTASLFEPFYRGETARSTAGGVGIGLAACRRIVHLLGGRIWARSRDDVGAEFGFALPIAPDVDDMPLRPLSLSRATNWPRCSDIPAAERRTATEPSSRSRRLMDNATHQAWVRANDTPGRGDFRSHTRVSCCYSPGAARRPARHRGGCRRLRGSAGAAGSTPSPKPVDADKVIFRVSWEGGSSLPRRSSHGCRRSSSTPTVASSRRVPSQ